MKNIKTKLVSLSLILMLGWMDKNSVLQAQIFDKGTVAINAGLGILSSIGYYSGSGVSRTPVISLSGEYGVAKLGPGVVGVGLSFGYQSASYTYNQSGPYYYKDKWVTSVFGLRGTYHPEFLTGDKYEVYGVIQLSFDHFGYKFTTNDPYYNNSIYDYGHSSLNSYARAYFMVGGRYYFTDNIGVYAELGYDIAYLKFGLAIKFGQKPSTETKK